MSAEYKGPCSPRSLGEAGVGSWSVYLKLLESDASSGFCPWEHFFAEQERVGVLEATIAIEGVAKGSGRTVDEVKALLAEDAEHDWPSVRAALQRSVVPSSKDAKPLAKGRRRSR